MIVSGVVTIEQLAMMAVAVITIGFVGGLLLNRFADSAAKHKWAAEIGDRDPETEVYDARRLGRDLRQLACDHEECRAASIAMIELDEIRSFDHESIVALAEAIRHCVGSRGAIYRTGRQFFVIMPDVTPQKSASICDAICRDCRAGRYGLASPVAIGVATGPRYAVVRTVTSATAALRNAVGAGSDRVVVGTL